MTENSLLNQLDSTRLESIRSLQHWLYERVLFVLPSRWVFSCYASFSKTEAAVKLLGVVPLFDLTQKLSVLFVSR